MHHNNAILMRQSITVLWWNCMYFAMRHENWLYRWVSWPIRCSDFFLIFWRRCPIRGVNQFQTTVEKNSWYNNPVAATQLINESLDESNFPVRAEDPALNWLVVAKQRCCLQTLSLFFNSSSPAVRNGHGDLWPFLCGVIDFNRWT